MHEWFKGRLDKNRFHLVGHSLGTFVSGIAGRSLIEVSNGTKKLQRITGLDPAEGTRQLNISHYIEPLDARAAQFVDVHHCDKIAGVWRSIGTIDVWYNNPNEFQPGCLLENVAESRQCSHIRPLFTWIEMISTGSPPFYARSADSWETFTQNKNRDNIIELGMNTNMNSSGNYFILTNDKSPFSKGMNGIFYVAN